MEDRSGRCREKEKSVPPRLLPCSSLCLRAESSSACSSSRAALRSAMAWRRRRPALLLAGLTEEARLCEFSLRLRRTLVDETGDEGSESSVYTHGEHWWREMSTKEDVMTCVLIERSRGERGECAWAHTQTNKYSVGSKEGQEKKS